jgi:RNA polymerase sigma factor (sigma-70 family)
MSALPSIARTEHAVLGADATRVLFERHRSRIFAFCLSRLGNREEAEDATQTTFLNAFRSLSGGVVPQFELAWLFRIADNVCRDGRKSAWRRGRLEATRDLQELQDVVSAPEDGRDGLVGLGDALAAMPERQRRAILLREWQGLSYGEIASELGVSRAAVETLIFRARRSLARGLEEPTAERSRGRAFDIVSLLGLAKSLFQGGAAAKLAVTAAAVGGAALVAGLPLRDAERGTPGQRPERPAPALTTVRAQPVSGPTLPGARTQPRASVRPAAALAGPARRSPESIGLPKTRGAAATPSGKGKPQPDSRPQPPVAESQPGASAPATPPPSSGTPAEQPADPAPLPVPTLPEVPALPPVEVPSLEPPALPPLEPPDSLPDVPLLP